MVNLPFPFCEKFYSVDPKDLRIEKCIDLYETLLKVDFSSFKEAFTDGSKEIIVFSTEPEVSQRPLNDIRLIEDMFVIFSIEDNNIPSVFFLRNDFPSVPHLNAMPFEIPRSLCLYEEPYSELKLRWRSIIFLERIREWLSLTSSNKLHQVDQPIEPFISEYEGRLILPNDFNSDKELFIFSSNKFNDFLTLIGTHNEVNNNQQIGFKVLTCTTPTVNKQVVNYSPANLFELQTLFSKVEIEIIDDLIKPSILEFHNNEENQEKKLIVIANIPRAREDEQKEERIDRIGFVVGKSIKDVFVNLKLGTEYENKLIRLINSNYSEDDLKNIRVAPLSIYSNFSLSHTRIFNGLSDFKFPGSTAMIGCGALGSQIFINLRRMGFINWSLIDDDILMPHNLARHFLSRESIGQSKSLMLSLYGNILFESEDVKYIQENYLKPTVEDELYKLLDSEVVLDVSASQSVARKLSDDLNVKGRKISAFLNPSGTALVIIAESKDKEITLNQLEALYYELLYKNSLIKYHFEIGKGSNRYSYSCRDISGVLEYDHVSMMAGIASKAIRNIIESRKSFIGIWSLDSNGSVSLVKRNGEQFFTKTINGWEFHICESLNAKIQVERHNKLPSETGGVLLGMVDFQRKITYITSSIKSPEDSVEFPNSYIRGKKGLEAKLKNLDELSAGGLVYVGEWHSHPDNCSLDPSNQDKELFKWIESNMKQIGYPPIMMIVGNDDFKIYNKV